MPLVEKRYAEALIRVGLEKNLLSEFQDELVKLDQAINSNDELKKFIYNPTIKSVDKKEVLVKIFSKEVSENILNFIKLLVDKGRMVAFAEIIRQYISMVDVIKKCLNIKVTTAAEISSEQLDVLADKFKKQYKSAAVKVDHKIDPSIIGGVVVKVGDKLIDGSVKGKLEKISDSLVNF